MSKSHLSPRMELRTMVEGLVPINRLDMNDDANVRWVSRNPVSKKPERQARIRELTKTILKEAESA